MDARKVEELKGFVEHFQQNPSTLHTPPLAFFKSFLQSMGARIPAFGDWGKDGDEYEDKKPFVSKKPKNEDGDECEDRKPFESKKPKVSMDGSSNDDIVESDVELDNSDVVEPDNDPPQKMGDPSAEVTEENEEAAQLSKAKAMEAIDDGKFNEAIDYLTDAIILNPKSAILYANRASIYIKLKKPNAAIRDADAALQINPDSAKGYKARGMARAMLGSWEESARDLHEASKIDFDEEIGLMLKKVEPNAKKIEEHHQKYERLRKEKELRKTELERKRRQDAEAASVFKDGEIIMINSGSELNNKLNAVSKTSRLAIIYFTATWCGPCRYVSPVFTSLAVKYPKAVFLKVDIDNAMDAAAKWGVSSIPSFFFVKNGKEVHKYVGTDKHALEQKIAELA